MNSTDGEQTPTQKASAEWAAAAFADPETRARFESMAKETAEREPVPDDFGAPTSES